ncbi:hypothetical protein C0991_012102 [Blastosporella zonata]|nr:hypothetical protein C0991_012102 [Blastosporella zonata]
MDPLYQLLAAQAAIDLKANGEVSRMRSHKGNNNLIVLEKSLAHPLPLMARQHAFASSNKCTSRGRECIFINDPETSRNKKLASSKRKLSLSASSSVGSVASSSSSPSSLFSESVAGSPTDFASALSPFSPTTPISPDSLMSMVPPLSISPGSSSTSSSQSSPRSDFFDNQPDMSGTFNMSFDSYPLESYLKGTFTGEPLFGPSLSTSSSTLPTPVTDFDFSWLEANEFIPSYGDPTLGDEQFIFSQPRGFDGQGFIPGYNPLTSAENMIDPSPRTSSHQTLSMDNLLNSFYDPVSVVPDTPQDINSADLDLYLNLFFSAFCTQIPLVHRATWSMEDKPLILVRAMQACGALFVRTDVATAFIDETLSSTRDALILEFAKLSTDPREQNNLLLTVVLLQTIGLFHQKSDQRISSNVYHGMLVMMIRRTGVIPRVNAWLPSDMSNVHSLDTAWRDWTNYEMIKRVLFLSYLHDCCHCMYFAIPPSFQPTELDICLPCDDALWDACDSGEWYKAAQAPSPYGIGNPRIQGFPFEAALTVLYETRMSTVTLALNPFAHFVLIHTILRNLYASHTENPAADASIAKLFGGELSPKAGDENDSAFTTQYALHNWLQMWLGSPESMSVEESREDPPFIRNALPFYWLAQVSLLAIQDGSAVFAGQSSDAKAEGRFRLMKDWLDHIRTFLRSGNPMPTHLWDELMKIRSQAALENFQGCDDHQNGLLAFFPSSQ